MSNRGARQAATGAQDPEGCGPMTAATAAPATKMRGHANPFKDRGHPRARTADLYVGTGRCGLGAAAEGLLVGQVLVV